MKLEVLSRLLMEEQKSSTRKQSKIFSAHQRFVALSKYKIFKKLFLGILLDLQRTQSGRMRRTRRMAQLPSRTDLRG
jgi:hypothetical protein